jgi:hypothetical protein
MDEHDEADPPHGVPELRNALSGTTLEVREKCVEEQIRQIQANCNNSNHGSPSSSLDMKRASSVSCFGSSVYMLTYYLRETPQNSTPEVL